MSLQLQSLDCLGTSQRKPNKGIKKMLQTKTQRAQPEMGKR